ncbi:hypothetical protein ACHAXN_010469 [Cyclotella atomus]
MNLSSVILSLLAANRGCFAMIAQLNVAIMSRIVYLQFRTRSDLRNSPHKISFAGPGNFSLRRTIALKAAPEARRQSSTVGNDLSNVNHWFTVSLPEGTCVGLNTAVGYNGANIDKSSTFHTSPLLHDEEHEWGQENIKSDASRTSFYLGRMALRSSLHEMLHSESNDGANKIWDQIKDNPIRKDNFGRPILPHVIVGSISHKSEYAVGLSRLRFDTSSCSIIDNDCMNVQWREECRIFPDDESEFARNSRVDQVLGIGVDIERINDKRSEKIQRKVLTNKEQQELGQLEAIGISKLEEVMLRFSLKESIYKAMHPILCDYVGLQEAEVDPLADGNAIVRLNFLHERPESVSPRAHSMVVRSASWRKVNGFFLTSASVGPGQVT